MSSMGPIVSRFALFPSRSQVVFVGHRRHPRAEHRILVFSRCPQAGGAAEAWTAGVEGVDVKCVLDAASAKGLAEEKLIFLGYGLRNREVCNFVIRYDVDKRAGDAAFQEAVSGWKRGFEGAFGVLYVYPDGRILLAGSLMAKSGVGMFALARMMPNGSLDHRFGDRGMAITNLTAGDDCIYALTVCQDGSIFAVGESRTDLYTAAAMAMYTDDGDLDYSFGRGGRLVAGFGEAGETRLQACAETTDGQLVAGGGQRNTLSLPRALPCELVVKVDRRGRLMPSFADRGVLKAAETSAPSAVVCILPTKGRLDPAKGGIITGGRDHGTAAVTELDFQGAPIGETKRFDGDRVSDMAWAARGLVVNVEGENKTDWYIFPIPKVAAGSRETVPAKAPTPQRTRSAVRTRKTSNPFSGKSEIELSMISAETHGIHMGAMNFAMSLPRGPSW